MIDAQTWLAPYLTAPAVDEPTRPYGPTETLHVGQVDDCGRILTDDGRRLGNGHVWIRFANLAAARYYGWQPTGQTGVDICTANTIVAVHRL